VITRAVLFAPWGVLAGREPNDAALGQRTSLPQAGYTDLTQMVFGINTEPFAVPANLVRGRPRGNPEPALGPHASSRTGPTPGVDDQRAA